MKPRGRPRIRLANARNRTLAWIGCGCATLLVVGGGGAAAAYYLGWFSGSGDYQADPDACSYLDADLAAGIATSTEPEIMEPEAPRARRVEPARGGGPLRAGGAHL